MKQLNAININTPQAYDSMYYGPRRMEMRAVVPLQALLPPLVKGETVLDVGCGVGQYFPYLAGASAVDGIDFAPQSVIEARETHGYRLVYEQNFANGFDLPDASYTMVFCAEVIEHMPDPQRLVNELWRLLQPGGVVLVATPYRDAINIAEHLWAYDENDMRGLFSAFIKCAIFRYSVGAGDQYEHLLVMAEKGR